MTSRVHLGPWQPFQEAGVLGVPEIQVAAALMRIAGQPLDSPVTLAAALCVRALQAGSVCVDLSADPSMWEPPEVCEVELPWPDPAAWVASAAQHPLVAQGPDGPIDRPLRLVGTLLYLQRYWHDEDLIRTAMNDRAALVEVDARSLAEALHRLFPDPAPDRQRLAAATAALRGATIVAGGPGTGKTTTVARIIAVLRQISDHPLTVALTAPTGKAAARLQEAVVTALADPALTDGLAASTMHRLLGWRPDSQSRFRHDRSNPLPHDVVVVDETSMVSLPMMARLLEAVRPDARLILVGDPDQLASIDAGAVLGDLVAAPSVQVDSRLTQALQAACPAESSGTPQAAATGVVVLDHNYRFAGAIAELADAIRGSDPDRVLAVLEAGHADVQFLAANSALDVVRRETVEQAERIVAAAAAGDAPRALQELESHRVLCAHREGPFGVSHWNDLIEGWTEHLVSRQAPEESWYVGRPLLVTANDYSVDLYNGDTGVVVASAEGRLRAAFARGSGILELPVSRLDTVATLRAMTIHRGQGSQFDAVTVVLPPADSPLLTQELLYTAVTRARSRIRIIADEAAVRAGVERHVRRASGLRG
jgi:exodeoxyribonuclease V alpha subunit